MFVTGNSSFFILWASEEDIRRKDSLEDSYNPSDMTEGFPIETEILQLASSTILIESTLVDAEIDTSKDT